MVQQRRSAGMTAGAGLVVFAVLQLFLGVVMPNGVAAETTSAGVVASFEVDGNHTADGGGLLDWGNVTETVQADNNIVDPTQPDHAFKGQSKENDPADFECQAKADGVTPAKDDLLRAAFHVATTAVPARLALGFLRDKTNGAAHVNFEFNQGDISFTPVENGSCPYLGRLDGDLLLSFDFPGNDTDPAIVNVFRWDVADDEWKTFALGSAASAIKASDNIATIATDLIWGTGAIDGRAFGEAALDLTALDQFDRDNGGPGFLNCPGFGSVSVRSRSSSGSVSSALQDFLAPQPLNLSTCGAITLKKVDDDANPLSGIDFDLFDNAEGTGASLGSCTTDDEGVCEFTNVDPADGPFWIFEDQDSVPDGYDPADNPVFSEVSVTSGQTVDLTGTPVQNPRQVGDLEITKKLVDDEDEPVEVSDLDLLDGTSFLVYDDDNGNDVYDDGEAVQLWKTDTDAACTISGGTGSCTIEGIPTGTYNVTETAWPDDTDKGPDLLDVVITPSSQGTVEVDYVNELHPLHIDLVKDGPASATVGDTVTYTFDVTTTGPPLTDITVDDLGTVIGEVTVDRCDPDEADVVKTGGDQDAWLEVGETWSYECDFVITADDLDLADDEFVDNTARATGTDAYGRDVSDDDDHRIEVLYPDIEVVKEADDDSVANGDPVRFDITVTNVGAGVAHEVELTDDLPTEVTWSLVDDVEGCEISESEGVQTLSCDFGDLPASDSRSVSVTGTTARGEQCATLVNTVVVTSSNEVDFLGNDDDDVFANNEDTARIGVACPDVRVDKTPDDGTVDAGDDATFTIVVTNDSATAPATDVVLEDELPPSLVWQVNDDRCQIDVTTHPETEAVTARTLACELGTVAAGGEVTITVTAPTTTADCAVYDNTATVRASNEDPELTDDNSDDGRITVVCPPPPPIPVPDIELVKDGVALAHRGDTIAYTFDVTNTGPNALVTVMLVDPICEADTLELVDDGDGNTVLSVGETWSYTCDHVVTDDDPDPLPNTATVTGTDANGNQASDTDTHIVDLIEPDIDLDKSVDDAAPEPGDTITFSYAVTNIGDTTLFDVVVTDDVLGTIGTIAELAPGQTVVLTSDDFVEANQPATNVAVAVGSDILGEQVSDTDTETIVLVLPDVVVRTPTPQVLPRTGIDVDRLLALAGLFLLAGTVLCGTEWRLLRRR